MTSIPMTTEYVDVKVKIGAVEFTNEELQIDSIKISNGCYDGSVFGIGNVYIKNASITMNYRDGITKGLNMEIFFEYQGAWISFGKFVVTETPAMSGDKISVSLESTLAQYANTEIVFAEAKPSYNFDTIIKKIEEITGKVVVFKSELDSTGTEKSEFLSKTANFIKDAKTLMDPASGCKTGISVRTALAGIAILFGGNVYEDTNNKIVIKQKTYSLNSDRYILPDYLDGNYKYSKEVYAIKTISLLFNKYVLDIYYRKETDPPGSDIWTQNYLDEDKVSNTLLASQSSMIGKTPYDYTVTCDWIGWTSDGFGYNLNETPGGRASACLRQGDLMYRTCDMTFVGIDFGWNIAPGNLIKVKVPELENPIDVLCGEISYEWDGGFTTNISCNCNIESNGSYSTEVSTQASASAAQEGRKTSLELNYANITFSNIEDSTIRGSIFKDGTIDGSKIKDSTITGSLIADSTIKGSNIEEGTITGSKIKAATITGALIVDGTIRGNHIMESSIDGSKIADSSITDSKIENSSITGSKFKDGTINGSKFENGTIENSKIKNGTIENSKIKDGTIENSKIKDATLTGAKIQDATIGFEKVNVSFIKDLTADKAYIENLKSSIADFGYLTAKEADIKYATIDSLKVVDGKIDNLQTIAITTNNLSAKVADLGYLKADTADLKYANIELSNIDVANVGTFFANVGLIDRATIVDGHVTGFLDSVEVNANKITAGTLVADRILLKGSENGLLYALNNLGKLTSTTVDTLDGYVLTDRTINADKIVASSITTNELDVDSIFADSAVVERIFAQDITATGIITGATLKGATAEIDAGKIGPLSISSDDGNLRFDLSDSYYLRIGGQIYGKGINIFDNSGFTQVIYSSSGIWMRDEKGAGWNTVITPRRITIGNFIHGTSTEGFEINVPTTIRDALRVESNTSDAEKSYTRINNHEVQLHAINSSVVFYLSAYSGSNNKFKLYSTNGNIVDVTDTTAMTITPKITASNGITEQGYGVVGCTVTKSGNFTCKKYRDGRLIIEFRFKTTSNVSLSNKAETYYATGPAATFPIKFTDVPAVVSGLGISNLNAPFCNVTFESVTKTGFGRYIIWTLPTISGYVVPSGSVVSATFTGRWK